MHGPGTAFSVSRCRRLLFGVEIFRSHQWCRVNKFCRHAAGDPPRLWAIEVALDDNGPEDDGYRVVLVFAALGNSGNAPQRHPLRHPRGTGNMTSAGRRGAHS
jgi:hypothetical protein